MSLVVDPGAGVVHPSGGHGSTPEPQLSSIPQALAALRLGRPVIVADDEDRENEGDVVLAAETATAKWMAWLVRHSSGFVCAPMTNEIADRLDLPMMVERNEDARGTAYTVTVDAALGGTTGISAADRANTLRVLADPGSAPASLHRPGHVLPLRAVDGGVRQRNGHTEATVELLKLAGLIPVGAISEIVEDEGSMMRLPGLLRLGADHGVPVVTIADLVKHLDAAEQTEGPAPADGGERSDGAAPAEGAEGADENAAAGHPSVARTTGADATRLRFAVETRVPTTHGTLRMRAYIDPEAGTEHVAIVAGEPEDGALVRVHSECLTGESFGSLKCECGPQLDAALDLISREGGIVVYLRGHEGRGIGLLAKLHAYRLQEDGLDTVDANLALGLPIDSRAYGAAVEILDDLGVHRVRLITNNPDKIAQLTAGGIEVVEQVPLLVGVDPNNEGYLEAKRDRLGHVLPSDAVLDSTAAPHQSADRASAGHPTPAGHPIPATETRSTI